MRQVQQDQRGAAQHQVAQLEQGRAVQLDPIKPTLKPPGTKHLNLKCDILLLSLAFNFNLRRFSKDERALLLKWENMLVSKYPEVGAISDLENLVGRCRLTLSNPRETACNSALILKYHKLLSNFGFKSNLRRYNLAMAPPGEGIADQVDAFSTQLGLGLFEKGHVRSEGSK